MHYDAKTLLNRLTDVAGPPSGWVGVCYGISCQMVESGIVSGHAVYGHWTGPVAKGTMFAGRPIVRHGWVILPDRRVFDPTRWVFEDTQPYIYIGKADHYDEGGNRLREVLLGPPPEWDPDEKQFRITAWIMDSDAWNFIEFTLKVETQLDETSPEVGLLTQSQLIWLANLPPVSLGEHAPEIYVAIKNLGRRALIPIDNLRMVERERGHATEE